MSVFGISTKSLSRDQRRSRVSFDNAPEGMAPELEECLIGGDRFSAMNGFLR